MKRNLIILMLIFISCLYYSCSTPEQGLTEKDYLRAESFLFGKRDSLVTGIISRRSWQENEDLIFSRSTIEGKDYYKFEIKTGDILTAFDQNRLADGLTAFGNEVEANDLDLSRIKIEEEIMRFSMDGKDYKANLTNYEVAVESDDLYSVPNSITSPNDTKAIYIEDYNLWLLNKIDNSRTQLTFDGEKDYGYGTNNAGWVKRNSPVLLWSSKSDKIATFRHDGRGVGEMYLYDTRVGHSNLLQWKYPLPGDSLIFRIERIIINLSGSRPKMVKLKMPPDPHRSTTSDHVAGRGGVFLDVAWNEDASVLSFVTSSRDHKIAHLKVADVVTGDVRPVIKEESPTYYEGGYSRENWRVLTATNEVIWFSEKSNWGHLYLHDLETGTLKNPITSGSWAVLDVHKIDEENRVIFFTGSNRELGDPYFHYLYKVNFDGSELTLLTKEQGHHSINWPPDKNYFLDTYSTPVTPPVTVVRDLEGGILATLGEGNIEALIADGWVPPEPFTVKARDDSTDLYGLMYKPSNFDPSKKYPVLNYLYPGPQSGSVGSRSFRIARSDKQAIAELGFVVVELDAMGTPGRSKSFHDAYYGNMGDNGLPDQVKGINQLAAQYPWMDIDKVGIWGHSGGGFASTAGILRYPDFYKVAVSSSGNHDNRNYEDDWGEKWHGLLVKTRDTLTEINVAPDQDNYDKQANQLWAENLKGKLLLAHGMLDNNVPPTNTFLVADALMKANKEFDMLMLPNARHGYGDLSRYFMKKRWNYFIEHLQGRTPIHDFEFKTD